ncbi:hypothetical protein TSMEX_006995 [Taenia solium]|eukprot:TsM_001159900 transcript=TsM_001159900 gene=TsM_001159900
MDDNQYVYYTDISKDWLSLRPTEMESLTIIFLVLLDVALLGVFTAMIAHMVLTMKYPESRYYSGENAYVRISKYLFTGKSRKAFKNLAFFEHEVTEIPPDNREKSIHSKRIAVAKAIPKHCEDVHYKKASSSYAISQDNTDKPSTEKEIQ